MTALTVAVIENNPRRNGLAVSNGLRATFEGAPALTGSIKQTAWADTIRGTLVQELALAVAESRYQLRGPKAPMGWPGEELDAKVAELNAGLAKVAALIAGKTEAGWWIDRRSTYALNLVAELVK